MAIPQLEPGDVLDIAKSSPDDSEIQRLDAGGNPTNVALEPAPKKTFDINLYKDPSSWKVIYLAYVNALEIDSRYLNKLAMERMMPLHERKELRNRLKPYSFERFEAVLDKMDPEKREHFLQLMGAWINVVGASADDT